MLRLFAIRWLAMEPSFLWPRFSKLAHVFVVFVSHGISRAALAHKGASHMIRT